MRTCLECGEEMRPSSSRMRVFSAMAEATALRVQADECPICETMVPSQGAVEEALRRRDAPTVPPPSVARLQASARVRECG
jgi:hypothetical protein